MEGCAWSGVSASRLGGVGTRFACDGSVRIKPVDLRASSGSSCSHRPALRSLREHAQAVGSGIGSARFGGCRMTDRRDLEGSLSRATTWVQEEFRYIEDIALGLGCERRLESGPGVAYRHGGKTVARAHPKRRYVAFGVSDRLRPDVQALTRALRPQKGVAWFNYSSDVGDRDTIALLLEASFDVCAGSASGSTPTVPRGREGRAVDDDADLRLVLAVLHAFKAHEVATGSRSAVKPLRETLFFLWEAPRLPPGRKYSPLLPHSPAAREHREAHGVSGLVYEHVVPIASVIRELLRNVPQDERALRRELDATADRVVITRAEDRQLTSAGYGSSMPHAGDPWSRYEVLGLQREDFGPFAGG
jgi:hypothetical protein